MTEADALLYMPGHPRDQLQRALRIPALSEGWRKSFEALLAQDRKEGEGAGNAGLTAPSGPLPAWQGFRPFRVSRKVRESGSVVSLTLEPADGKPVPPALPGQFVVLRLEASPAPALLRSYSLSGAPGAAAYRVSVKREAHGAASAYIDDQLRDGDIVNASAARGNFTLRPGTAPVVLVGAGIGLTPLLAMLHALAAEASLRDVWWLYGTRNGREHPFAEEVLDLLKTLPHSHKHIRYSAPEREDRPGIDFDAPGRLTPRVLDELHLPHDGDFYICGPSAFMSDMTMGLVGSSIARDRIHTEMFGTGPSITPGIAASPHGPPHLPRSGARRRPARFLRTVGDQRPLGPSVPELARTRRGLRRACPVVVPERGLPHVRERARRGNDRVSAGAHRRTCRRERADLLFATQNGSCDRFVNSQGAVRKGRQPLVLRGCSRPHVACRMSARDPAAPSRSRVS